MKSIEEWVRLSRLCLLPTSITTHPLRYQKMMFTTINVRGTKFDVNNDTLRSMPYFGALLARWSPEDMVIDRCPESFRHILDFLVYGYLDRDALRTDVIKKIISDADFYGTEGVADEVYRGPFFTGSFPSYTCDPIVLRAAASGHNPDTLSRVIESIIETLDVLIGAGRNNHDEIDETKWVLCSSCSGEMAAKDLTPLRYHREIVAYAIDRDGTFSMWDYLADRCDFVTATCRVNGDRRSLVVDGINQCSCV